MANNINKIAKSLKKSIKTEKGTKAYDTAATVTRIEGKTAWVHIPGGVDETPVKLTMNAKKGETVQVRVSGGKAWLTGNASAPPTDDTTANKAQTTATEAKYAADNATAEAVRAKDAADRAETSATQAQASADQAQASADSALVSATNASEYASRALGNLSTVQSVSETLTWITQHGTMAHTTDTQLDPTHVYFIVDANGDYIVGNTHYSIVSEPDVDDISTYYELTIDESLNNYVGTHLALTNEGLWLLPAASGTNKVLIATGSGTQYTTAGTYIIGSMGETLARFAANGLNITTRDGNTNVEIANLGYGEGNALSSTDSAPYYTFGTRKKATQTFSTSSTYDFGDLCIYNGKEYVCVIPVLTPGTWNSTNWKLSRGNWSVAEGTDNIIAYIGHVEGYNNTNLAYNTHVEGRNNIARGTGMVGDVPTDSHVGGRYCRLSGDNEGTSYACFVHGVGLNVYGQANVSLGKYNANGYSPLTIGNGTTDSSRSNALRLDDNGDLRVLGDVYVGCNTDSSGGTKLEGGGGGGGGSVTGVKGNAESTFRTGNVNLTPANIGAVPATRTINSKALSNDITLTASDVSAVPTTRTVNGKALSSDITLKTSDLTNDSGYITSSSLPTDFIPVSGSTAGTHGLVPAPSGHADTDVVRVLTDDGGWTTLASYLDGSSKYPPKSYAVADALATKQATLISGTNIKTINGNSLLGSGDITISGGGASLPVGAVYESINDTDPSSVLGNTWEFIGTSNLNGFSLVTSDGDSIITSTGDELESITVTYKFLRTA